MTLLTRVRACLRRHLWRSAERAAGLGRVAGAAKKGYPRSCAGAECDMGGGVAPPGGLHLRLLAQSSETTVDAIEKLRNYIQLLEWAKCGEGYVTVTPTLLWAVGTAALTQRMIRALFRRFIFRRVPMWELVLQNLLFIWVVIYSLHFWVMLVKAIKIFVDYCYEDTTILGFNNHKTLISSAENLESRQMMQQWMIWLCGVVPLAVYFHTRPQPETPPLMIWITASPWLRREMGPYGYYLNRPFSTIPSATALADRQQALSLRKAFSDTNILIKEPPKRKRHSKSV